MNCIVDCFQSSRKARKISCDSQQNVKASHQLTFELDKSFVMNNQKANSNQTQYQVTCLYEFKR